MTAGVARAGETVKRSGTIFDRVRKMVDDGLSKQEIRDQLDDEGANPVTVDAYLKEYAPDEGRAFAERAKASCLNHLADLQREHGAARA